ncbi:PD-(D/E)XK nuclease family protein [Riemerella anatipestifer]|nr:PD-(D/E)XK nuclease family protein [Riemerella anatipestifer]
MGNLLQNINTALKKYNDNIYKNGENFNIYSLLGLERQENNTHSKIIAELLSPDGSHGQGDLFLQLFLSEIYGECHLTKDFIRVTREYYCGQIDKNSEHGGRIDILIENGNKQWMIENKIDAIEQYKQLERYHNKFPNGELLFLTMTGYQSSFHLELSEKKISYKCISYQNTICSWLEKCITELEKNANKSYLKTAIQQYLNLIKNMNNKGINQEKQMEIINEIKANIEASFEIKTLFNRAVEEILKDLSNEISDFLGLKEINSTNWNKYFTKDNWENLAIGFEHEGYGVFLGICTIDNSKELNYIIHNKLKSFQQEINDEPGTSSWRCWKYFIETNDEENYVKRFISNSEKKKYLIENLKIFADYLDKICI